MFIVTILILLGLGCFGSDSQDDISSDSALKLAAPLMAIQDVEQAIKFWKSIQGYITVGDKRVVAEYNHVCSALRALAKDSHNTHLLLEGTVSQVADPESCEWVPRCWQAKVCLFNITDSLQVLKALEPLSQCQINGFVQSCESLATTIKQSVQNLFESNPLLGELVAESQDREWVCDVSLACQIARWPLEVRQPLCLVCPRLKALVTKGEQEFSRLAAISFEPVFELRPYMSEVCGPCAAREREVRAFALSIAQKDSPEEKSILGSQQEDISVYGFLQALASFKTKFVDQGHDFFMLGPCPYDLEGRFLHDLLRKVGEKNLPAMTRDLGENVLVPLCVWETLKLITKIGLDIGVRLEVWQFVGRALNSILIGNVEGEDLLHYLRFLQETSGDPDLKSELMQDLCLLLSKSLPSRACSVWDTKSKIKNINVSIISQIVTLIDRLVIKRSQEVWCFFVQCLCVMGPLSSNVAQQAPLYSAMLEENTALSCLVEMVPLSYEVAQSYARYLSEKFPVSFWWDALFLKGYYVEGEESCSRLMWDEIRMGLSSVERALRALKRFIVDARSSDQSVVEVVNICEYLKESKLRGIAYSFVSEGKAFCLAQPEAIVHRRWMVAHDNLVPLVEVRMTLFEFVKKTVQKLATTDNFAHLWAKESFAC